MIFVVDSLAVLSAPLTTELTAILRTRNLPDKKESQREVTIAVLDAIVNFHQLRSLQFRLAYFNPFWVYACASADNHNLHIIIDT